MDDQIKLERLRNLSNKVDEWVELEDSVLSNKTKQNTFCTFLSICGYFFSKDGYIWKICSFLKGRERGTG